MQNEVSQLQALTTDSSLLCPASITLWNKPFVMIVALQLYISYTCWPLNPQSTSCSLLFPVFHKFNSVMSLSNVTPCQRKHQGCVSHWTRTLESNSLILCFSRYNVWWFVAGDSPTLTTWTWPSMLRCGWCFAEHYSVGLTFTFLKHIPLSITRQISNNFLVFCSATFHSDQTQQENTMAQTGLHSSLSSNTKLHWN